MPTHNILTINTITPTLQKIFEEYKHRGMLSIYLWGSVTTNDYNKDTSDIDTIAIVDNTFDKNQESLIQKQLQSHHKDLNKFGFRIIYKTELETGQHIQSNLSLYIHPRFLVFDLPNWLHIAGQRFAINDFTQIIPSVRELMLLKLDEIQNRNWNNVTSIKPPEIEYYIKCLWRILHLLQIARGIDIPFSYPKIASLADKDERGIVVTLSEIKKSGYNKNILDKNAHILNMFVKMIKRYKF